MGGHNPLMEWTVVLVLLAFGLSGALAAGKHFGLPGAIAGFVVGVFGLPLVLMGLTSTGEWLRRAGPRFPACHTGKCKGRRWPSLSEKDIGDYEQAWVGDDVVLRCRCGRDYVTREAGERFLERLPDGTLKPYMVHRDYRGWFPDEGKDD